METIKALHIASFNGNIGDNANHNGFRRRLEKTLNKSIEYTQIEMREFYQSWNLRNFNSESFVDLCNEHDVVIIGGGNFFELKWDYSSTGTTVDITSETLDTINTPIIFHGVGCDIAKGATDSTIEKFENFLDRITNDDNIIVSVRNDGSMDTIWKLYGDKYKEKIYSVPDGAFFMEPGNFDYPEISNQYKSVGVNIVSDMSDIRFNSDKGDISYSEFIKSFANTLNGFLEIHSDYQIIFFPHIYSDYDAINETLTYIDDKFRRTRVVVSPLLTGEGSERYIFGLYAECELILGMRFHSNVCAVAQNIPTIGLSSYKKIIDVYKEIGLYERVIEVNKMNFDLILNEKIEDTLLGLDEIKEKYKNVNNKIYNESLPFYKAITKLI